MASNALRRFLRCRSGATAIEYGLIASSIFLVIVASVTLVSTDVSNMFNNIANTVATSM